jgi:repressor LexA
MSRLRELRKGRGLRAEDVADQLGCTVSHYYELEKGRRRLNQDHLRVLSRIFGVPAQAILDDGSPVPGWSVSGQVSASEGLRLVPIVGTAAGGLPIMAEQNILGFEIAHAAELQGGEHYFLTVKGNSMRDVGIVDGSLVLVRKQEDVDDGDIAVVLVDREEATIKRVRKFNGTLILEPANSEYQLQIYKRGEHDIRIEGRVVAVRRKF